MSEPDLNALDDCCCERLKILIVIVAVDGTVQGYPACSAIPVFSSPTIMCLQQKRGKWTADRSTLDSSVISLRVCR